MGSLIGAIIGFSLTVVTSSDPTVHPHNQILGQANVFQKVHLDLCWQKSLLMEIRQPSWALGQCTSTNIYFIILADLEIGTACLSLTWCWTQPDLFFILTSHDQIRCPRRLLKCCKSEHKPIQNNALDLVLLTTLHWLWSTLRYKCTLLILDAWMTLFLLCLPSLLNAYRHDGLPLHIQDPVGFPIHYMDQQFGLGKVHTAFFVNMELKKMGADCPQHMHWLHASFLGSRSRYVLGICVFLAEILKS